MDVRSAGVRLWLALLASWLAGVARGKGHVGGKLAGGGGHIPVHAAPAHINAVYPAPHPPCHPVTQHINEDKYVTTYVTIYSTLVEPVVVPTTFYHTSYVTSYHDITKFVYSTLYDEEIVYDSSVAVGTDYISVTDLVPVPAVTTVTDIRLKVVPSVVTAVKGVTVGSAGVLAETSFFTQTVTVHPTATVTDTQVLDFITATSYTVVTQIEDVSTTVTVKVRAPRVTSTVLNTEVVHTPVYVTQTEFHTVETTVTERRQVPYTVTVQAPCQLPGFVEHDSEEDDDDSGVLVAEGGFDIRAGAGSAEGLDHTSEESLDDSE